MAGLKTNYTIKEAKEVLAAYDMTIRHNDGEYRVAFKQGSVSPSTDLEATACYETSALAAIETGIAMRDHYNKDITDDPPCG